MTSKDDKAERERLRNEYLRAQQTASAARMPLDRPQLEALLDHVEAALGADGCDHTPAATEAWAAREGVDPQQLLEGLGEYGGFCDCEVVVDVGADEVSTPVRASRAQPPPPARPAT
jgi:hypothetical protein